VDRFTLINFETPYGKPVFQYLIRGRRFSHHHPQSSPTKDGGYAIISYPLTRLTVYMYINK